MKLSRLLPLIFATIFLSLDILVWSYTVIQTTVHNISISTLTPLLKVYFPIVFNLSVNLGVLLGISAAKIISILGGLQHFAVAYLTGMLIRDLIDTLSEKNTHTRLHLNSQNTSV